MQQVFFLILIAVSGSQRLQSKVPNNYTNVWEISLFHVSILSRLYVSPFYFHNFFINIECIFDKLIDQYSLLLLSSIFSKHFVT